MGKFLQVLFEDRITSSPMTIVTMSSSSLNWKKDICMKDISQEKVGTKAAMGLGLVKVPKGAGSAAFGYPPPICTFQSANKGGRCTLSFRGVDTHSLRKYFLISMYKQLFSHYQERQGPLWQSAGGTVFYFFRKRKQISIMSTHQSCRIDYKIQRCLWCLIL